MGGTRTISYLLHNSSVSKHSIVRTENCVLLYLMDSIVGGLRDANTSSNGMWNLISEMRKRGR